MEKVKKNDPLHSQAYQIIKSTLLQGEYEAGERLIETTLARRVGVSRGPIREALRMLTQEGLVEERDGHLHVYKPQMQDVIDVYLCRQSLESLAVKLAAKRMNLATMKKIEEILYLTRVRWKEQDITEVISLNTHFHRAIIESSENKQLIKLTEQTSSKVVYIRSSMFQKFLRDDNEFMDEHEKIFEAIAARDEIRAEQLMFRHIQHDLDKNYRLFQLEKEVPSFE